MKLNKCTLWDLSKFNKLLIKLSMRKIKMMKKDILKSRKVNN